MKINPATCELLNPRRKSDWRTIQSLYKKKYIKIHDTIDAQLGELYCIRNPQSVHADDTRSKQNQFIEHVYKKEGGKDTFGMWAWYPNENLLMKVLPEDMHVEILTARNRNLITKDEQEMFYHSHIGIAGLSVGNSILGVLLHSGGGKFLRIADKDVISGSNLNRIRTGFNSVGLPKTYLAAREIFLLNPYSHVTRYDSGITEKNVKTFLCKPQKLHVVVDEMDDLYVKIQLRLYAREARIPVVMVADNGDGIVVDIERFDLEPTRPLMHGSIPELELRSLPKIIPKLLAARIISSWVGRENIAPRMKSSLTEIGKSLYTWPQLGTAATCAGAIMAIVVRHIVTGQMVHSGKYVFHPEALLKMRYS